MLVIPFDRKLDWKRPPVVTVVLVLLNVLAFFLLQGRDEARMQAAADYYYDSGLHALELPRYREALALRGEREFLDAWEDALAEPESPWLWRMLTDGEFMQRLRAEQVITPESVGYADWRLQRARFQELFDEIVTFRWGFTPAQASPLTAFSHMFLHGDLGHLLGNMFFLLAVGFLVEGALGRWTYLGSYLLGGLGAVGLFSVMNLGSGTPLVGASGAIAALMGMYAVLFGRRKISFFYYVGVYFDYVKAPAVLLLVLWLGYELVQYFWLSPESSVAYMAHVGGLLSGAAIAFVLARLPGVVNRDYLEENERKAVVDVRRQTAADHMQRLDFDKALPILQALLQEQPQDRELLSAAMSCARFDPVSEGYHQLAHRILLLPEQDEPGEQWIAQTYQDYVAQAKPRVRLPAPLVRALANRFTRSGEFAEAERMVRIMLRNPQAFPDAPAAIARLANTLLRRQHGQRARHYFQLLLERYPAAPEAGVARQVLQV